MTAMVKKISLSLIVSLITLLLLELVLRLVWLPPELNEKFQRRDLQWREENAILNSYGYRDEEYELERNDDTLRIYSLGDSYTFGWYINDNQKTYPQLLEKALNEKLGKKVEVINAATPGFSLKEEINRFETEGMYFHPDLLTIGLNYGEFNLTGQNLKAYRIPYNFLWRSRLYQATLNKLFQTLAYRKRLDYFINIFNNPQSAEWQEFEELILSLKKEAEKINTQLMVIIFPHLEPNNPDQAYQFEAMHQRLAEFTQREEIFLIDPLPFYLNYPKRDELVINPIDPHPSEVAHQLITQAFIDQFDFEEFEKSHQPYLPKIRTVKIDSSDDNLGAYVKIRKIESTSQKLPWVYFETKYGQSVQQFPLRDFQKNPYSVDINRLQTAKSFTHEGIIGASLKYRITPDQEEPGTIKIPNPLDGYPIVGLEMIQGFYFTEDGGTLSEYLKPQRMEKMTDFWQITFEPEHDYYLLHFHLAVGVKQLEIKPDGSIEKMVKTELLTTTVKNEVKELTFKIENDISGLPLFIESPTVAYSYAFVNNVFTPLAKIEVIKKKIKITFKEELAHADKVVLPVLLDYQLAGKEVLTVEIEEGETFTQGSNSN